MSIGTSCISLSIPSEYEYLTIPLLWCIFHWKKKTLCISIVHLQLSCWLLWYRGADTWFILTQRIKGCWKHWYKIQVSSKAAANVCDCCVPTSLSDFWKCTTVHIHAGKVIVLLIPFYRCFMDLRMKSDTLVLWCRERLFSYRTQN